MSNTVPALGYLDRNAEQILILENQFCPISEKILKKIIYIHNMRTYYLFLCSCAFYNKCHFYSLFMLHLVICTTGNCINKHTHTHTHVCKSFCLSQALSWRKWPPTDIELDTSIVKGKAVLLQTWSGPEGSRKLRFPDFMATAQDSGKVVSLTHRPPLPPGNTPGTHFC